MSGELLGRRLLRLDALYCAGAGLVAVLLFAPLADLLHAPPPVLLVAGVATLGWAVFVHRLATRPGWRAPVAAVAVANAAAAAAIVALAVGAPATAARVLLVAVAVEVAAFAAGQFAALRR